MAEALFIGSLDRAIADLKEAGKDYEGLILIKAMIKEAIK